MRLLFNRIAKLLLISFFISSLLHAVPEVETTSPARGVYIPMFGNNGDRNYEIFGSSGEVVDDNSILISNMILNCFNADNQKNLSIISSYADVQRTHNSIQGNGVVFVDGINFTAVASDWKFLGDEKKFVANKDIKVLFNGNIAEFLAP